MDLYTAPGQISVFVANEALDKDLVWHQEVAKNLFTKHVDVAIVKVHDGENRWYPDIGWLQQLRQTYLNEHVGMVPFGYCYGPKFGDAQIYGEANVIKEICSALGAAETFYCADMEVEWNGNPAAVQTFIQALDGMALPLGVSTWADPIYQNWVENLNVLDPHVYCWMPQRYSSWLSDQPFQVTKPVVPTVDLNNDFGPNNAVGIAARTPQVTLWNYTAVMNIMNKSVVEAIVAQKKGFTPPAPPPPGNRTYTVVRGDTLTLIAQRFGVNEQDLYNLNKSVIESTASAHGFANSGNGNWIFPGEVLSI